MGLSAILICLAGSFVVDLAWISGSTWLNVIRRTRSGKKLEPGPVLLGVASMVALVAIGSGAGAVATAAILSSVRSNAPPAPSVSVDALRQRPLTIPAICTLTPRRAFGNETVYGSDIYNVRIFDARTDVFHAGFFNRVQFRMYENEVAVVRGRQIGGEGVVRFEANGNSYVGRSVARSSDGTTRYFVDEYDFAGNGNTVYATVWVDAAGCYVLQIDSGRGTQMIVVAFR